MERKTKKKNILMICIQKKIVVSLKLILISSRLKNKAKENQNK